jgi:NADH:ubiquinone oxidoreductase subunit F (NADH-binding)/(2Fe-2S) ferredoxin
MKITSLDHLAEVKERGLHHSYPDRIKVMVGMATCGISAGADKVYRALGEKISEYGLNAVLTKTGCIGFCQMEPLVDVVYPGQGRVTYQAMTEEKAARLAKALKEERSFEEPPLCCIDREEFLVEGTVKAYPGPFPGPGAPRYGELEFFGKQKKISLRNCGFIDPENIEEYISRGGYHALFSAITEMTPDEVIARIKESGLRGRGGAGFPTGVKWDFCRQASGDLKYVICNADEGDPGAFMDRSILEGDPHSVLEGMAIGGYAMGANQGYIYCRAEYPMAVSHLKTAIAQARSYGVLGEQIFGRPFSLDVIIREGAGAFVCGEETALIASIEGRAGEPRPRPPFPAQSGLWGKPTVINNVKTWSQISPIVARGAQWYASLGEGNSKGTTVFSLVGKVRNSGLVEVPLGITLREMIFGLGGGISKDRAFKAVQTGGPSGGCIPAEYLDTPVNYDSLAALGSIMGSGGMIVMDDQDCMVNVAKYFLEFTRDESCGKCTPCREGTLRLYEMLEAVTEGRGREGDIEELERMARLIKKTSLCGLGATAPNPVLTTIKYFRDEYEAHIRDRRCPAKVCKALITYTVLEEKCNGCQLCRVKCPVGAVEGSKRQIHRIMQDRCTKCGTCFESCRFEAIAVQ